MSALATAPQNPMSAISRPSVRRKSRFAIASCLGLVLLLTGLSFVPVLAADSSAPQAAPDEWKAWSDNFNDVLSACVAASGASCLSKAFTSRERPALSGSPPDVADTLYRDLRTADVLLHQKDARDLLWRDYGIDGSDYLGTGYSVPLEGPHARNYEYASQREYFVPNLCAEAVDPAVCPRREDHAWSWRLNAKELSSWLDRPIAMMLRAHRPAVGAAAFARHIRRSGHSVGHPLPELLIRFGDLPAAYYKGTFGRPGAARVFFADYNQVRSGTLRGAIVATGAASLIERPDPEKTFFVWVYAPDGDPRVAVASWRSLFSLLSQPAKQ